MYIAIESLHEHKRHPITVMCEIAGVCRSAFYKWRKREKSQNELQNEKLLDLIIKTYGERNGILGYRQMTIKLRREHNLIINYKRVYRLMKIAGLKSVCRRKKHRYIKSTPEITAENVLNRNFKAKDTCEKWLTDVTEFKYGNGQKAYLSAILDLGDRSIVSYVIGRSNNNALVFQTFESAVSSYPNAKPIFHSDRGFQYTSKIFKEKLNKAEMTQSMSRVGCCIDNGPMEGFWGILKTEMYHLHRFDDFDSLSKAIEEYLNYYNTGRYQKNLRCMTPIEYRNFLFGIAA